MSDRISTRNTEEPGGWQRAADLEAGIWRSLYRWVFRRPLRLPPGSVPFSYAAGAAPILWVFVGMSAVEIPILHLLLPAGWWRVLALVLGAWGLLWMIGLLATFKMHPHEAGDPGIRIRNGTGVDFSVPWSAVEAVSSHRKSLEKSRTVQVAETALGPVLQIVVASQTNVAIRLREPLAVPVRRSPGPVVEIRIYADDPPGFVAAAKDRLARTAR
jgi:hypothetical protein